jgi:hypothetical protein
MPAGSTGGVKTKVEAYEHAVLCSQCVEEIFGGRGCL